MNLIGVLLNMIAIVLVGDYGLFADGAAVHEDSPIYDTAWELRHAIQLG